MAWGNTAAAQPATDRPDDGRVTRPWPHVLAAALTGLVAAHLAHAGLVLTFFTGIPGALALLVLLVVVGVALGALAVFGTRSWQSAWVGTTALLLVPGALVADLVPIITEDGAALDRAAQPLSYAVGVVVAVVPALLLHRGLLRRIGLVALVAVLLAGIVAAVALAVQAHASAAERDRQAIARAQAAIGADFRPVTISIPGYGSIYEANIEKRLPGFLQVFTSPAEKGHAPGQTTGSDPTVVTLAADMAACGRPIAGVGADGASEPETSCAVRDGVTTRAAAHGHEVSAVVGDALVAVSAGNAVDVSLLEAAVRSAEPIDDAAYRHVVLGDGGEYTDELDGNRCPVTAAACG